MNRRFLGLLVVALVVITVIAVMALLPRKQPKPPVLLPSPTPEFTIRTANDLYEAENRLNQLDFNRFTTERQKIDDAAKAL